MWNVISFSHFTRILLIYGGFSAQSLHVLHYNGEHIYEPGVSWSYSFSDSLIKPTIPSVKISHQLFAEDWQKLILNVSVNNNGLPQEISQAACEMCPCPLSSHADAASARFGCWGGPTRSSSPSTMSLSSTRHLATRFSISDPWSFALEFHARLPVIMLSKATPSKVFQVLNMRTEISWDPLWSSSWHTVQPIQILNQTRYR